PACRPCARPAARPTPPSSSASDPPRTPRKATAPIPRPAAHRPDSAGPICVVYTHSPHELVDGGLGGGIAGGQWEAEQRRRRRGGDAVPPGGGPSCTRATTCKTSPE